MVYALEKYVDVLLKLDIKPSQLFFCQIIYEKRHDLLYKIAQEGHSFPVEDLNDLEDKGLIVNTNPEGDNTFADFFEIKPKFINAWYSASKADGEEFWKMYPPFITIQGKKVPVKGVNKEELVRWYHTNVGTMHEHGKVIEALEYAVKNKLISMRIDKWLQAEAFVDIWKIMEDEPDQALPHERII